MNEAGEQFRDVSAGEFLTPRRLGARLGAARQFYFWPRVSARREVRAGEIFFFGRVRRSRRGANLSLCGRFFAYRSALQHLVPLRAPVIHNKYEI